MSRLPRAQEYLKTGFTAEAAAAARFRAYAGRAAGDGRPNLARAWLALAAEKDALAVALLAASGQVRGGTVDLAGALAEERFENESLYPRMLRDVDESTAGHLRAVVEAQAAHAERLAALAAALGAADADLPAE